MSILCVGSMAFDSVETPFGRVDKALGGSANFFSIAASYFSKINLVGVVGEDYPIDALEFLTSRGVDLGGLQIIKGSDTFIWKGKYGYDLNEAQTLTTCLNVFEHFKPELPENFKSSQFVFLANIDPDLQKHVLEQIDSPKLVACDTMNFWINRKLDGLKETLKLVDILLLNESEARQLSGEYNLVRAARAIRQMGPDVVVIKRGEYGSLLFDEGQIFSIPAMLLEEVFDPTGAGDSFAGGFIGYLAESKNIDHDSLRMAVVYGTVMASFSVEDFSFNRMKNLSREEIESRVEAFLSLTDIK